MAHTSCTGIAMYRQPRATLASSSVLTLDTLHFLSTKRAHDGVHWTRTMRVGSASPQCREPFSPSKTGSIGSAVATIQICDHQSGAANYHQSAQHSYLKMVTANPPNL